MDDPATSNDRQLAVSALTTEHFNLQSERAGTIGEANGRSSLYLGTLSSAVIAIAFMGSAGDVGTAFYVFVLTLLPCVFLLGIFTYMRLVQTSLQDVVATLGQLRIREYLVQLHPSAAPYFPQTDAEGISKLERMGVLPTSRGQTLLTNAAMVAMINAIVGGVTVGVSVRVLASASIPVAVVTGIAVAGGLTAFFLAHQIRRFRRAAAVVPELFGWGESGLPRWAVSAPLPRRGEPKVESEKEPEG